MGLMAFCLLAIQPVFAQNKTVSGKVTDEKDGSAISGASITVKGTKLGTQTDAAGTFTLSVPASATILTISSVGFGQKEMAIGDGGTINISLVAAANNLNEIVVIGYGSVRKKDLTGSVATVGAKDFNKGVQTSPDQLIQGKVAGVQVINNSGQPGGATTFKIRGNSSLRAGNTPLFVIDGVILDGSSARPGANVTGLGQTPDANPLNFINPADIQSMDVLKDASATAIYGSRGANGVVLITTRKGQSGLPKIDVGSAVAVSKLARKIDIMDAEQYRQELKAYNLTFGDQGGSADIYDELFKTAVGHNQNLSVGGGNENTRYRFSANYLDQEGTLKGTGLKKLVAGFNSSSRFLESKKLGLDINLIVGNTGETIGAISNDAGFTGNVISTGLQWNPTENLRTSDGKIKQYIGSTTINPLEFLEGYSDKASTSIVMGSISPSFKITNDLEYKLVYGFNHGLGERRISIRNWVNVENNVGKNDGFALIGNKRLFTQIVTQTLNYNHSFSDNFSINGLLGYEYMSKSIRESAMRGFHFGDYDLDYTDYMQYSANADKRIFSSNNPDEKIRSYFGRVGANIADRYLITATLRADGSSKFGRDNRFGYFPSFALGWNISKEKFFQVPFVDNLKIRGGWGITGNQEFPSGASQTRYLLNENQSVGVSQFANNTLKWQQDKQTNVGIDFTLFKNRLSGVLDYFTRNTNNLLFPAVSGQPGPGTTIWMNLPGKVQNKGVEITLSGTVIKKKDFNWDLSANATFVTNKVSGLPSPIQTGSLNGQGMSGTLVQLITNDQPINTFYTRDFQGFDDKGQAIFPNDGNSFTFKGSPNPKTILGITTNLSYKKVSLNASMNGSMGYQIYNNTANSVLPINNLGARNISSNLFGNGESLSNPITSSSRYLESGNYLKMANLTASYNIGKIGKVFKTASIYLTAQNLFVITKYTGFDPEVNTDKQVNGIPSVGIDYIGYPSARTLLLGISLSL